MINTKMRRDLGQKVTAVRYRKKEKDDEKKSDKSQHLYKVCGNKKY